jgi:hypothetical protein
MGTYLHGLFAATVSAAPSSAGSAPPTFGAARMSAASTTTLDALAEHLETTSISIALLTLARSPTRT